MVKRLATSPHDPLGITDSACKNQLVVVSVQYGQDLGLIHSTNGNHLESPNEGSSIDHQVALALDDVGSVDGEVLGSRVPSRVSSVVESIDSASPVCQAGQPWLPRSEELPNSPWYEEKSSTLRLSDIDIIKEKGGTMGKFEVVIPHPDERAHRPPPGFHTFYMNQIEMGLRFPIPRFIAAFCRHIQLSPSQLAPNSYSFILALAVLLSYHDIPLIPYVLMQLVQVKRLGPGKLYLSHKGANCTRGATEKDS
ncbi:hypothetical protein F511_30993 [Dorcoceras hygrometricum]|uniref:Uncharacterized protein n=1 Tax=Dorcoceras hygrometricum TaxID=472368 RepID=A0A2Z7ABP6_9LAMI|nr:hypothetical protein F511_30993 [Dorcoceras hygrometricum]